MLRKPGDAGQAAALLDLYFAIVSESALHFLLREATSRSRNKAGVKAKHHFSDDVLADFHESMGVFLRKTMYQVSPKVRKKSKHCSACS